jgi:hypothetical protein
MNSSTTRVAEEHVVLDDADFSHAIGHMSEIDSRRNPISTFWALPRNHAIFAHKVIRLPAEAGSRACDTITRSLGGGNKLGSRSASRFIG